MGAIELVEHALADLFPRMPDEEYQALKADIATNGLHEPITLCDGRILDGRHRYRACNELGIKVKTRDFPKDDSAVAYVVSMNLHRRNLTSSQRAAIAIEAEEFSKAEADARERRKRKPHSEKKLVSEQNDNGATAEHVAKLFGTNQQYVKDAKKLAKESPKLAEQIKAGEITITQAKREIKEAKRKKRRAQNARKVEQSATIDEAIGNAKFSTIVIDPPWDWGDEGDVDQLGRARPTYKTLTLEELLAFPVGDKADDDCHLYLWITNRSLPKGFSLLEAWGFRYVTCLTWCKPSIGMGNYFRGSTEHVLFGVRGSQQLNRKDVGTWFAAPRGGEHSAKPVEFVSLVESCSPGPYLEIFARDEREGWTCWGGEL